MSFDLEAALERVGGDEEILKEIADLFTEDAPDLMASIQAAVGSGDAEALEKAAHALKGSVSNFGAEAAVEAALNLEVMGRDGDLANASAVYDTLEEAINGVVEALSKL